MRVHKNNITYVYDICSTCVWCIYSRHTLILIYIYLYLYLLLHIYTYLTHSLLVGYFVFQGRYAVIDRSFRSPLGVYGAAYAMIIFAMIVYSLVIMQDDGGFVITFMIIYGIICTIYYYTGPNKRQVITDEEFRCNVINANYRRKHGSMMLRILRFLQIPESQIKQIAKMSSRMSTNNNSNNNINSNNSNSISANFTRPLEALRHHSSNMLNAISNKILPTNKRSNQVSPSPHPTGGNSAATSNKGGALGIVRSASKDSQKSTGSSSDHNNKSTRSHIDADLILESESSDIRRGDCGGILVTSMNDVLSDKNLKKKSRKKRDSLPKSSGSEKGGQQKPPVVECATTVCATECMKGDESMSKKGEFIDILPTNGSGSVTTSVNTTVTNTAVAHKTAV